MPAHVSGVSPDGVREANINNAARPHDADLVLPRFGVRPSGKLTHAAADPHR